jgi:hypothetical protein
MTDYRRRLRERGFYVPGPGRPRLPAPLDLLREGWRRAKDRERAVFMTEVGLVGESRSEGPHDDAHDVAG